MSNFLKEVNGVPRGTAIQLTDLPTQTGTGSIVLATGAALTNPSSNNFTDGLTSSTGNITLTSSSNYWVYQTGSTPQTIVMPAVNTLSLGWAYAIVNAGTSTVTVQSSGNNTIATLSANQAINIYCVSTTGTTASSWNYFNLQVAGAALPVSLGGTGQGSALNSNGVIYAASTSAMSSTTSGSAGQLLQSNGSSSAPSFQTPPLVKNYLSNITTSNGVNNGNGNFELGTTTGWSLGIIGTLTNGLPTGTPTFGSGSNSHLSISATSSSPISGGFSLAYVSTQATTAGDMLASNAFFIDSGDQAKVLTVKFYYQVTANAGNDNFSGTSSNSFAWAAYDVTNSSWLTSAGNFNLTQNSGVGYCTGTLQTNATTTQIRFVFYNANATLGNTNIYLDDIFVGPQTAPSGPAMTDFGTQPWTPTGNWTTNTSYFGKWRRVGDSMEIFAQITLSGAPNASTTASINIPTGYTVDATKTVISATTALGSWVGLRTGVDYYTGEVSWLSSTAVQMMFYLTGSGVGTTNPATWGAGDTFGLTFKVPIVGWSSNSNLSSDTDTRVATATVAQAIGAGSVGGTFTAVPFTSGSSIAFDTHGAMSTSTGVYTIPVTGYWSISSTIAVTGTWTAGTSFIESQFSLNGTPFNSLAVWRAPSSATYEVDLSGTRTFFATAGTTVAIGALSNGGTVTWSNATVSQNFSINRITGPAVVAATESVNCNYSTGTTQSITNNTDTAITCYTTKYFDSHNAFNTSTGVYTAPVSGKYRATLYVQVNAATTAVTAGASFQAIISGPSNSALSITSAINTTNAYAYNAFTTNTFAMLAGQTLTFETYQTLTSAALTIGGGISGGWIAVERIGN